jgi:hypothetical protein
MGFDALKNAPDRQISDNARDRLGNNNSDGPCEGEETCPRDVARSALPSRALCFLIIIFILAGPNYVLGCMKIHF